MRPDPAGVDSDAHADAHADSHANADADADADAVDAAAVQQAAARIAGHVRRTPLWRLRGAELGLGCAEVWLKLEHLQRGGSFKARGMFNALLARPAPPAGVLIASGGNA
ncbi:MAG: pyridoxal-phosphate dependent enzyme, partial [Burkholderiales bacterium]|nr:pyridoxal-phosphate dependent enzyme [Burkholderiales bacterium]